MTYGDYFEKKIGSAIASGFICIKENVYCQHWSFFPCPELRSGGSSVTKQHRWGSNCFRKDGDKIFALALINAVSFLNALWKEKANYGMTVNPWMQTGGS